MAGLAVITGDKREPAGFASHTMVLTDKEIFNRALLQRWQTEFLLSRIKTKVVAASRQI